MLCGCILHHSISTCPFIKSGKSLLHIIEALMCRSREESDTGSELHAKQFQVSIHALVKRATLRSKKLGRDYISFNSRSREESDNQYTPTYRLAVVSIHALVKRATNLASMNFQAKEFQFTLS